MCLISTYRVVMVLDEDLIPKKWYNDKIIALYHGNPVDLSYWEMYKYHETHDTLSEDFYFDLVKYLFTRISLINSRLAITKG